MRKFFEVLLSILLLLAPRLLRGAEKDYSDYHAVPQIRTYQGLQSRMPSSTTSSSIRACSYYGENYRVYDIARLEMHSSTCQQGQSIDRSLPDRPEEEVYRVGEPFDVPKRN
ncbi:hypothetical protein [Bdellovibrio sp. NC01]|uniref:hypothetical protein n=1 Tax=Bdellovibrio sp. NC01 TaxID=2220073 RepID=UPI001159A977|nr:hypothetical protein [Bdellovibrio sp. NC01]QDK39046.1 hypothetical protein DOE51_16355 [Bdellovibrio sp. NC01]